MLDGQIVPAVVGEVTVGRDERQLDAGVGGGLAADGLEFHLARLEVAAVDQDFAFDDLGGSEDGRWGFLGGWYLRQTP